MVIEEFNVEPMGDKEDGGGGGYSGGPVGHDDQVTVTSGGSQVMSSFKNVFTGIICFIIAWPVLWCGATRTEKGKVFQKAQPIASAPENELAWVSGNPESEEIGDGEHLAPAKYLRVVRDTQYYAVISESHSESHKEGTKQVTKSYYTYRLDWTSSPSTIQGRDKSRWSDFVRQNNLPYDIQNPTASGGSQTINANNVKVSGISVNMAEVSMKGGGQTKEPVYLSGNAQSPQIGDQRLVYTVYPADQQYTFAGKKSGSSITGAMVDNSALLVASTGSFENLVGALKSEDRMMFWVWLIVGFVLMSAGLNMMLGPITTLLDFIPFIGTLGASAIRFVLTLTAAILSLVFYFAIYYWWVILIVVGVVVIAIVMKKKGGAAPAAAK